MLRIVVFSMKLEGKKLDFAVVILLNGLTGAYAYLTKDLFIGKMFFAGMITQLLPIIYLSLRKKKQWKKLIVSVVVFDLLFESFDFIAEYTNTWTVTSVVLSKIAGVLPLDNVVTHQAIVLYTLVFYQHFFEDKQKDIVSKRVLIPLTIGIVALFVTFLFYSQNATLFLTLKYPYAILGTLAIIPALYLYIKNPKLFGKVAVAGLYFSLYYFISELIAARNGYWVFKGDSYIAWVEFFGYTFPFEEFFFWVVVYAPTIIAYYILWIDGQSLPRR